MIGSKIRSPAFLLLFLCRHAESWIDVDEQPLSNSQNTLHNSHGSAAMSINYQGQQLDVGVYTTSLESQRHSSIQGFDGGSTLRRHMKKSSKKKSKSKSSTPPEAVPPPPKDSTATTGTETPTADDTSHYYYHEDWVTYPKSAKASKKQSKSESNESQEYDAESSFLIMDFLEEFDGIFDADVYGGEFSMDRKRNSSKKSKKSKQSKNSKKSKLAESKSKEGKAKGPKKKSKTSYHHPKEAVPKLTTPPSAPSRDDISPSNPPAAPPSDMAPNFGPTLPPANGEGPSLPPAGSPVQQPIMMNPTTSSPVVLAPPFSDATPPPVAAPLMQPVSQPTAPPASPPVAQPLAPPVMEPVAQPAVPPVSPPISSPTIPPVSPPVAQSVTQPIAQPVSQPMAQPTIQPATVPTPQPVRPPVSSPVAIPVSEPISPPVQAPLPSVGHSTPSPFLDFTPAQDPSTTPRPTLPGMPTNGETTTDETTTSSPSHSVTSSPAGAASSKQSSETVEIWFGLLYDLEGTDLPTRDDYIEVTSTTAGFVKEFMEDIFLEMDRVDLVELETVFNGTAPAIDSPTLVMYKTRGEFGSEGLVPTDEELLQILEWRTFFGESLIKYEMRLQGLPVMNVFSATMDVSFTTNFPESTVRTSSSDRTITVIAAVATIVAVSACVILWKIRRDKSRVGINKPTDSSFNLSGMTVGMATSDGTANSDSSSSDYWKKIWRGKNGQQITTQTCSSGSKLQADEEDRSEQSSNQSCYNDDEFRVNHSFSFESMGSFPAAAELSDGNHSCDESRKKVTDIKDNPRSSNPPAEKSVVDTYSWAVSTDTLTLSMGDQERAKISQRPGTFLSKMRIRGLANWQPWTIKPSFLPWRQQRKKIAETAGIDGKKDQDGDETIPFIDDASSSKEGAAVLDDVPDQNHGDDKSLVAGADARICEESNRFGIQDHPSASTSLLHSVENRSAGGSQECSDDDTSTNCESSEFDDDSESEDACPDTAYDESEDETHYDDGDESTDGMEQESVTKTSTTPMAFTRSPTEIKTHRKSVNGEHQPVTFGQGLDLEAAAGWEIGAGKEESVGKTGGSYRTNTHSVSEVFGEKDEGTGTDLEQKSAHMPNHKTSNSFEESSNVWHTKQRSNKPLDNSGQQPHGTNFQQDNHILPTEMKVLTSTQCLIGNDKRAGEEKLDDMSSATGDEQESTERNHIDQGSCEKSEAKARRRPSRRKGMKEHGVTSKASQATGDEMRSGPEGKTRNAEESELKRRVTQIRERRQKESANRQHQRRGDPSTKGVKRDTSPELVSQPDGQQQVDPPLVGEEKVDIGSDGTRLEPEGDLVANSDLQRDAELLRSARQTFETHLQEQVLRSKDEEKRIKAAQAEFDELVKQGHRERMAIEKKLSEEKRAAEKAWEEAEEEARVVAEKRLADERRLQLQVEEIRTRRSKREKKVKRGGGETDSHSTLEEHKGKSSNKETMGVQSVGSPEQQLRLMRKKSSDKKLESSVAKKLTKKAGSFPSGDHSTNSEMAGPHQRQTTPKKLESGTALSHAVPVVLTEARTQSYSEISYSSEADDTIQRSFSNRFSQRIRETKSEVDSSVGGGSVGDLSVNSTIRDQARKVDVEHHPTVLVVNEELESNLPSTRIRNDPNSSRTRFVDSSLSSHGMRRLASGSNSRPWKSCSEHSGRSRSTTGVDVESKGSAQAFISPWASDDSDRSDRSRTRRPKERKMKMREPTRQSSTEKSNVGGDGPGDNSHSNNYSMHSEGTYKTPKFYPIKEDGAWWIPEDASQYSKDSKVQQKRRAVIRRHQPSTGSRASVDSDSEYSSGYSISSSSKSSGFAGILPR